MTADDCLTYLGQLLEAHGIEPQHQFDPLGIIRAELVRLRKIEQRVVGNTKPGPGREAPRRDAFAFGPSKVPDPAAYALDPQARAMAEAVRASIEKGGASAGQKLVVLDLGVDVQKLVDDTLLRVHKMVGEKLEALAAAGRKAMTQAFREAAEAEAAGPITAGQPCSCLNCRPVPPQA